MRLPTLEEAEKSIRAHLRGDGDLAVAATPGTGKTRLGVEKALELAADGVVIYAMPNHRLIDEWVKRVKKESEFDFHVQHVYGRFPKGRRGLCRRKKEVKQVSKLGYAPSETVCSECEYEPSRGRGRACAYYRQFEGVLEERRGLLFCTTHQLPYLMAMKGFRGVSRVFIDEQALEAMLVETRPFGLDALQTLKQDLSEQGLQIVDSIETAARECHQRLDGSRREVGWLFSSPITKECGEELPSLWKEAGVEKQEARAILSWNLVFSLLGRTELFERRINLDALEWIRAAYGPDLAWVEVRNSSTDPIQFKRLKKHKIPEHTRITVLDATADSDELRALFGREFDVLDLKVPWKGKRVWLRQGMGKNKTTRLEEAHIEKHLSDMLAYIPQGVRKGLLVTFIKVEEIVAEILRRIRPRIRWQTTHFYASRGLNQFEDAEVVLCFGVPTRNLLDLTCRAVVLFPTEPEKQADWKAYQNDGELSHCVHRARFIRHPGRTLIVLGHRWPKHLLGQPDHDENRRRQGEPFQEAVKRALEFFDTFGFFDRTAAALVGVGMRGDADRITEMQGRLMDILGQTIKNEALRPPPHSYTS